MVIVGRPNVGKSTLFNRFLGSQVAIVEDQPGITRDRFEREVEWTGKRFNLVDTGGWMPDGDELDAKVSLQVEEAARTADLVLFVVDASIGATDDDDLALELSSPGLGGSLLGPGSGGSGGDLALGEAVDEESIFTGEGGGAVAGSQTVVRGGAPALGSGTFDDDLSLESIVGASSPSLGGGDAASPPTDAIIVQSEN